MYKAIRFITLFLLSSIFSTILILIIYRYAFTNPQYRKPMYSNAKDIIVHYGYWVSIMVQYVLIYIYAGKKDIIKPTLLAVEKVADAENKYKENLARRS